MDDTVSVLNPKVMVPYITKVGEVPRKVQIERFVDSFVIWFLSHTRRNATTVIFSGLPRTFDTTHRAPGQRYVQDPIFLRKDMIISDI